VRRPGNRRGLVIWLVAAGVSLALLCACGGLVYTFLTSAGSSGGAANPTRPRDTPLEAAVAFLTDVQAGDLAGAYERTCTQTRDRCPRDRFDQVIAENGKLSSYVR